MSEGTAHNATQSFTQMILDNLKTAGVQQAHKENKIIFTSGPTPWPVILSVEKGNTKKARAMVQSCAVQPYS
jgi:adenine-specific DNA-methyltransferase